MKLYEEMLEILEEDGQNVDFFTESNTEPSFMIVSIFLADEIAFNLDQVGIPYIRYNAKKKALAIFFIKDADLEKTEDIEKGIRIKASLPLLSMSDLKTAIYESNDRNSTRYQVYTLKHIPENIAARIFTFAGNTMTLGIDREADGGYTISCHEKKKNLLEKLLLAAMFEAHAHSNEVQVNTKKSVDRLNNKAEYEQYLVDLSRGEAYNAVIASAIEPNNYLQLKDGSATLYMNGKGVASVSARYDKSIYSDKVKVIIAQMIKDPVFISEETLRDNLMTSYNPAFIQDIVPETVVDENAINLATVISQSSMRSFLDSEAGLDKLNALLDSNNVPDKEAIYEELIEIDAVTEPAKLAFAYIAESETGFDPYEIEAIAKGKYMEDVEHKTDKTPSYNDTERIRTGREIDREKGGEI